MTLLPAVILVLAGWLWLRNGSEENHPGVGESIETVEKSEVSQSSIDSRVKEANTPARVDQIVTQLNGSLELLKRTHGAAEGQEIISQMFDSLNEYTVGDASRAIVQVLNTKEDALAFGRFAPGPDGFLNAYPSFRTALLDQLEKLDPVAALKMGKSILTESENADEWALSLRMVSRNARSTEDLEFLQVKVQELLHKEAWLDDPTFSFLHAFDATVDDGREVTIQRLGELLDSEDDRAVAHAATVSLDRLFQNQTLAGVGFVTTHPEFLDETTGFRASLMARIDPSDTQEVTLAELYLGDSSFSNEEKRTFFQLFPNFNSTFSYNLIHESKIPTRSEMREASIAAVGQLSIWANENRYPEYQDDIYQAMDRLAKAWKLEL